jgi:hypothetical protein
MPEHDKQQWFVGEQLLADKSTIDKSCEPPLVEELRGYSKHEKSKAIPDATC